MKLFGRKEIKHSEAYTDFKAQLKAVGRQRMEGYDPNLFDKITEQERSEVEKDIWNHFMNKNDADLAVNTPIAVGLAGLAKKPGVYDLLVDIYLHDKDETNRVQAIVGILWRDGKLNSVNDPREFTEKIDLIRAFMQMTHPTFQEQE